MEGGSETWRGGSPMIQVPPNANVLVMHEPINFRTGIDGTAAIARLVLEREPMDGAFFRPFRAQPFRAETSQL